VPPDSVRCTWELEAELATFGKNGRSLRYNSSDCPVKHRTVSGVTPDCPVCQRSNGYFAPTIDCNALNALQCAPGSEHAQEAHRTVYRTCPVHHRITQRPHQSELQRLNPNGRMTWLAHRIVSVGAPDCLVRHATAALQRPLLVVGAINTPTTPHSIASKFSTFNTLQEL
jgi:hypothetical protein